MAAMLRPTVPQMSTNGEVVQLPRADNGKTGAGGNMAQASSGAEMAKC